MKAKTKFYYMDEGMEERDCDIVLNNHLLSISYDSTDNNDMAIKVEYNGKEIGQGHFRLNCKPFEGTATLHSIDYCVFDGWYKEYQGNDDTIEGMWQIICDKKLVE